MAEIKTKPTDVSVDAFLDGVEHPVRRADGKAVRAMMERVTGEPAVMWGPSIVGFGSYHYRYASGHEGDMCRVGFSPRSANLVLYVGGFPEYEALLAKLGKYKRSKACLYLNKLADVDPAVIEQIAGGPMRRPRTSTTARCAETQAPAYHSRPPLSSQ
jgi:hypothetical protein